MTDGVKKGSAVYPVYLSMQKPLDLGDASPQDFAAYWYPHGAQIDPAGYFTDQHPDFVPQTKGLGVDWKDGDFSHNLTDMLRASYNAGIRFAPEIKEIVYDFDSRQFVDAVTGERRDRRDFARISERLRGESSSRYRGGSSTLARAALVNTLLRGEGKEAWSRVVAAVGDQLRGRGLDFELREIFYRRNDTEPGTTNNPSGLTTDQFRAALVERFGASGVKTLEDPGLFNILDLNDTDVRDDLAATLDPSNPAWYNPNTSEAFFIAQFTGRAEDAPLPPCCMTWANTTACAPCSARTAGKR